MIMGKLQITDFRVSLGEDSGHGGSWIGEVLKRVKGPAWP